MYKAFQCVASCPFSVYLVCNECELLFKVILLHMFFEFLHNLSYCCPYVCVEI